MPSERIAIITGSGKGIGRAVAQRLAQDGITVIVNYLSDAASANETLALVQPHTPGSIALQADVARPDGAQRLAAETLSAFGRIDILVNNAGPFLVKSLADTEIDEWRRILDGNLSSAFYCIKYVLPAMRTQKSGQIINLGTLNAELARGAVMTPAYNAAKSALVVLTKSVARSEAQYGIRCNIVNPGFIETYATPEKDRHEMPSRIPLGRLGKPEDIAEAIGFLISDKARYINGAVLNVHGGLWA